MTAQSLRSSNVSSRLIDFAVLLISFLLFAMFMGFGSISLIAMDLLLYVGVVFVCVRLSKRVVFEYIHSSSRSLNVLLGNIIGLFAGSATVLLLGKFVPAVQEMALVVVFSSVTAFFILGTLSPMVKSSYRDIIHH